MRFVPGTFSVALSLLLTSLSSAEVLNGSDFSGGAKELFGTLKSGEDVNYVYAQPTGKHSSMKAELTAAPGSSEAMFLHIKGLDDDAEAPCSIRILLNNKPLFEGESEFSSSKWEVKKFPVPQDLLREKNVLVIENIEKTGGTGNPPWFMVAACGIGPESFSLAGSWQKNFQVKPPAEKREFPEPLKPGEEPGFKWRGTKGWLWKPEQYLAEIPYIAQCKMNFLMNCYGSMCDIENLPFGDPKCNRWYEPLPDQKKKAYEKVVAACQEKGITFCFSMNPNLSSSRFVNSGKPEDVDALWQHYDWMQGLGVKWFNISLDDITQGIDATGQAKVVNEILARLRKKDPEAQMIFCPTYYWGDGSDDKARPYLEELAKILDKDVYLFWTGDAVVGPITRKGAETYRRISQRRLFLWDNYPVNDAKPTLCLGPVVDRAPDLCAVVDGYMGNPLHSQNEINRIPMFTCADYAYNPKAYDPMRSVGQAILHLETGAEQRDVIRELVEMYAGMLIYGIADTGFNSVRHQYQAIARLKHGKSPAAQYIKGLEQFLKKFQATFPDKYQASAKTIENDIAWVKKEFADRYGE